MTGSTDRTGAHVVGAYIDAVDCGDCLNRIFEWVARRESRYICLCNAHSVVTARRDPGFGRTLNEADLAVPDGAPVAWRLGALGYPGQPRVSGSELMWKCCARAAGSGVSVFLYGSRPETLRRLSARLIHEYPRLKIAGCYSPPFRDLTSAEDVQVVDAINDSGAGLVFVSLGCPKQETWMAGHRGRVHAAMMGVGAAFEFHAGTAKRAPRWMQNMGLEWLHRLASEPQRLWRRYFVTNTLFLAFLLAESLGVRRGTGKR
jgi:N-acetylglucosaminyldiphosphoundecaprenol N-acetyl-beta-D-mannosaminyltransferase